MQHGGVLEKRPGEPAARQLLSKDRVWEDALSRMNKRMASLEVLMSQVEARVSEAAEAHQMLAGEVQKRLKRSDFEDRLDTFRGQVETDMFQKFHDMTKVHVDTIGKVRSHVTSLDEAQRGLARRLASTESSLHERVVQDDVLAQVLVELQERLADTEHRCRNAVNGGDIDELHQRVFKVEARCLEAAVAEPRLCLLGAGAGAALEDGSAAAAAAADASLRLALGASGDGPGRPHADDHAMVIDALAQKVDWLLERVQGDGAALEAHNRHLTGITETLDRHFGKSHASAEAAPGLAELVGMLQELAPKIIEHERTLNQLQGQMLALPGR